jgi:putative flippase GtrA
MESEMAQASRQPVPLLTSLKRSQIAASIASALDFAVMISFVEILRVRPVAATAVGCIVGAMTSFALGRQWSFKAGHGAIHHQALRYAITAGLSVLLNTTGMYLLNEAAGQKYLGSRIVISLVVGLFFNFPMHRHFVFR